MSTETIPPRSRPYTVEEFFRLVQDGEKADLIDGEIVTASPDTLRSDKIGYFVRFLLQGYAEERKAGETFGSRVAFVLEPRSAPEPDISFVSTDRLHIMADTRGQGAPDIAVEIVSSDSRSRDYARKKDLYERAAVREYWIIAPPGSTASSIAFATAVSSCCLLNRTASSDPSSSPASGWMPPGCSPSRSVAVTISAERRYLEM
jgi:Uma2 family endonuclease